MEKRCHFNSAENNFLTCKWCQTSSLASGRRMQGLQLLSYVKMFPTESNIKKKKKPEIKQYSESFTAKPSGFKLSEMWSWVPSASGVSETAARPPSPVADSPSALPSPPPLSPPVSNASSREESVTLLACSLDASPCVPAVALYLLLLFARYCIKD